MKIFAYISIIRPINILMIGVTMYMTRMALFYPVMKRNQLEFEWSSIPFYLLVLSIILLAAGGNVLNDKMDVEADNINKPNQNKVGSLLSKKHAHFYYLILTAAGLILGWWVSMNVAIKQIFIFHIFIASALYLYSVKLNKTPLIGNVIVATLIAILPWIVTVFEATSLEKLIIVAIGDRPSNGELAYLNHLVVIVLVFFYSILAYLSNFARELIKDIEDIEGDTFAGYRTVPIVHGLKNSKLLIRTAYLLLLLFVVGILIFLRSKIGVSIDFHFILFSFILIVPILISFVKVSRASTKNDYRILSSWNKIAQMLGILSMFYFYILFLWN